MADRATRHRRNVGDETKIEYLREQNNICPYCGKPILLKYIHGKRRYSLDHVVPYSVFKWTEQLLSEEDRDALYELVHVRQNYLICHLGCNEQKNSFILRNSDVNSLYVDKHTKQELLEHLQDCEKYTNMYDTMLDVVLERQNYCCTRCLKRLHKHSMSLRRYNENMPRNVDNAVALCTECSSVVARHHVRGTLLLRR